MTGPDVTAPALAIEAVSYGYTAKTPVLHDIEFTVEGGVVGILGNNGAGKSTLLKLAAGLMAPSRGRVRVLGVDIAREPLKARRSTAFLPESLTLDGMLTPREFLHFVADLRGLPDPAAKIEHLLERLGGAPHADSLFREISFGMRRKVGVASAFLTGAPLVVLDEPGNGLDVASLTAVEALIGEHAASGGVVLMSSHDMAFVARSCSTVRVIAAGREVARGTPDELVRAASATDLHQAFQSLASAT
ncbi:MAG: ABC transporter ATP-binding protein [Leptospirillia bacterium]